MLRKHRILIVLPVGLIFISLYDLRACIQTGSSVFNQVVGLKTRIIFENENSSKENIATKASCYKTGEFNTFYICNDSLPFSSTACGKSEQDALEYKVPNIVHYVWFGEMNLKYYHYLSVRSAAANQHPDAIMFHINGSKPGGEYWEKVEKEIPCITLVKMEAPTSIHNKEISDVLHQTDVARMQILLKYGGIYLDSDVIILKSMNPLRKYPFTIGRSTEYSLSNGVMLSEPDSSFIKEWMSYFNKYDQVSTVTSSNCFACFINTDY
uniref:uncharacterized protein LOC120328293 n=1 Tax=Styela clava TaxID=7725 RepID=UPI001939613D|nr:uncharacterized protein LOC120328293 [Styela clava]